MNNKRWLLALNRINKIGPRTIMKLLERWPNLEEMFNLPPHALQEAGLPERLANAIHDFNLSDVDTDLEWETADKHHLLTWEDSLYPRMLKEIYDPPAVLYAAGDLSCLEQTMLSIIGTRKPSVSGKEIAWRFAKELSCMQITIVSGLAHGIDASAHSGCLSANGSTIAVMGTGINIIYPRAHQDLARKIKEQGLLLTEFPLNTSPTAGHFPRRNRIISGLSLSTLVVEAAIRSGSLITARLALEQNRDVLAIPGSIHNPQASGCHYLLQQGAKLVTSTQDVIDELGIGKKATETSLRQLSLATDNKNLVKCFGFEITTIDQLVQRSGYSVETVASELAQLELSGIVKAVPGGYFRCEPSNNQ